MSLIERLNFTRKSDLLIAIRDVDKEAVVVDANTLVGIARVEGNLGVGGEGVGRGCLQLVDDGVLEFETGLAGAQHQPDY